MMSYQIIKMGSLYIAGIAQSIPDSCISSIPMYKEGSEITLGHTVQGKEISWIRPKGLNILIADRGILQGVSWDFLEKRGFIHGKMVNIDGQWYRLRLPRLGSSPGETNEWDEALNICGTNDKLWHWRNVFTIGQEKVIGPYNQTGTFSARGGRKSPRDFKKLTTTAILVDGCPLEFRPVLEIAKGHLLPGSRQDGQIVTLEGQRFCLTLPGGNEKFNDWDESAKAFRWYSRKRYPWSRVGSWTNEQRTATAEGVVVRGAPVGGGRGAPRISTVHIVDPTLSGCGFAEPVGFRPLLVPIDKEGNMDSSVFGEFENGTVVEMYSLLMGGVPVLVQNGARAAKCADHVVGSKLVLTDNFFGNDYLISWVIFNGKAIALKNLVCGIKWSDLVRMRLVKK